ncbi:MAG: hypothetical protein HZA00_10500 [Nitrospinae bacterium]|nr:hypothetical protein [Nitrospinota bacterium]
MIKGQREYERFKRGEPLTAKEGKETLKITCSGCRNPVSKRGKFKRTLWWTGKGIGLG